MWGCLVLCRLDPQPDASGLQPLGKGATPAALQLELGTAGTGLRGLPHPLAFLASDLGAGCGLADLCSQLAGRYTQGPQQSGLAPPQLARGAPPRLPAQCTVGCLFMPTALLSTQSTEPGMTVISALPHLASDLGQEADTPPLRGLLGRAASHLPPWDTVTLSVGLVPSLFSHIQRRGHQ